MTAEPNERRADAERVLGALRTQRPIAPTVQTFDGQRIDTTNAVWTWRSRPDAGTITRIDFGAAVAAGLFAPGDVWVTQRFAADRLSAFKGRTVENDLASVWAFARFRRRWWAERGVVAGPLVWAEVSVEEILAFNEHQIRTSTTRSGHFSRLRTFLAWLGARAPGLLAPGLVRQIGAQKALRCLQGEAVRTEDPVRGALTRGEQMALRGAVDDGLGTEFEQTLTLMSLETGLYGEALSDLRSDDIEGEPEERLDRGTGLMVASTRWTLGRPRVKKRTAHRETKPTLVTDALGRRLAARATAGPWLFPELRTDDPNRTAATALTRLASAAGIVNERTGQPLRITVRRLRYTLATELAADGHDPVTIAHALDHGDTKEAKVYVETSRRLVERVNAMVAPLAAAFVARFRGLLGSREETRARHLPMVPNQGPSLASDVRVTGIGACGAGTLCRLAWPLSCYGCPKFVAWADGPHAEVLAALGAYRDTLLATADTRIVTELDGVILAVREVIAAAAAATSAPHDPHTPEDPSHA